ncbi:MAG: hypothetical protein BGO49_29235 [Planctomycetales bacterium 71-10]|nr:MAG: hypothetical protein BGO49_29235 [Planctomycetales bacterium 71-10]
MGSQVTEDQIDKLRDAVGAVRTPVVVLAADNDDAGRACVEKLTGALRGYCEVRVAYPPAGCKDFGEMRPEDVARVIKEAVDMDTLDDENAWKRAEALARANPYPKISHGGMLIWPTVSLAWHLSRLYGGGVFPLPAHKLAAKFEAHPFMVEKCLKEMVDEGYVVADGDGYRWTGFRPKLDVHHVAELRGCSPEAVVQAALAYGIHKAEGRKVTREEMSKLSGKAEVVGPELVAAYLTGQPQPEVNWPTVRTDDLEIAALLRQAGFVLEPDGLSVKLFPFEDWWAVRRSVFAAACKGLEVMVDSPF